MFLYLIKGLMATGIGLFFWVMALLVFYVYGFMPASKQFNEMIFTIVYPILHILLVSGLLTRVFKEKGWRAFGVNALVTLISAGIALLIMDVTMKIMDLFV